MKYELGFIGAGNMAEAICRAAIDQNVLSADQIIAADPSVERRDAFVAMGVNVADDTADGASGNEVVLTQAKQVMLAVKPQIFPLVVPDMAAHASADQVLISIMAGMRTEKINTMLGEHGGQPMRIVRVMPNTPLLVSRGMAGIATGNTAHDALGGSSELARRMPSSAARSREVAGR